jgi:hypothetical protein
VALASNGVLFDGTVCDGQPAKYFYPPSFTGSLYIYLQTVNSNGTVAASVTVIPSGFG